MEFEKGQSNPRGRCIKLPWRNKVTVDKNTNKLERSSDIITLDDSFDRLISGLQSSITTKPKIYSPIVIDDSCNTSQEDTPEKNLSNEPSKSGNVSMNSTKEMTPLNDKATVPSNGGWSPAQNILCATPRNDPVPTTTKDVANESQERCSIKTIHKSYHKLLSDLYGDTWKSIPSLIKSIQQKRDQLNGISKKLYFHDDDDDENKENIKHEIAKTKELYLTGSDHKNKKIDYSDVKGKSKKKLYTETVPNVPELPKLKLIKNDRDVKSTTKKPKAMSVTELVKSMNNDVDLLTKKVHTTTPKGDNVVTRLSFVGSLADNIPTWRCHVEAIQYHDNYKTLREQLTRRLFNEFNKVVFNSAMDADMPIIWDNKLRSTAGTTTSRLVKTVNGDKIRTSSIKLSSKVVDGPQRLRDTLIHEMCHAATWIIDKELRAGHGPVWKKWATRALRKFPELDEISRCHTMEIHYKYCFKCTKCGYSIKRHSKSIDITKKCCGYCFGKFEIIVNKKNKDGVVVSTPARKAGPNDFALFVKENYSTLKNGRSHAQVMKLLGAQFSAKKSKKQQSDDSLSSD